MADRDPPPGSPKLPVNIDRFVSTPTMEDPAIYRVIVKDTLGPEWSNRLAGMQITGTAEGRTILVGRLNDQAALSGVLLALYELHLPVISVDCLDAE